MAPQTETKDLTELLEGWPRIPRQSAQTVTRKYGPPDEATDSFLLWHRNGPWKRTVLWRDQAEHRFPQPHQDVLEQVIDYFVPAEFACAVLEFDGSVVIERTRGEISARCEGEEANFLALNLAHRIVQGEHDADSARDAYTRAMRAFNAGEKPEMTQRLTFEVSGGGTADPDQPTLGEDERG
jgi:hypothetical protein